MARSSITRTLCEKRREAQAHGESGHGMTINMLPDDVLLEIFDSYRKNDDDYPFKPLFFPVWRWHELVHVCQRWQQIVFGSARRLDLQIICERGPPVREKLDYWPFFPISIRYFVPHDNLFAALEHPGRIRQIDLILTGPQLREVAMVMQDLFPALTHLNLRCSVKRPSALPSGFLGGSAPCLQYMRLDGIHFPELPTLLSSTSELVTLYLVEVLDFDDIAPEAMVASLAALPRLQFFFIYFRLATPHPNRIIPPLVTRTLLPALTSFVFQGDNSEYLEELVSRIDGPRLKHISINFLSPDFRVAPLFKFVDRSEDPEITLIKHADVLFSPFSLTFNMSTCTEYHPDRGVSAFIPCQGIETQFSYIAQVFSQPSAMLSRVVHLNLSRRMGYKDRNRQDSQWLHLFRHFSTVRTLYVAQEFSRNVGLALEDAPGEMVAEVLPVLDLIYLDGQPVTFVEKFLTARRVSGCPVATVDTEAKFQERVKSYVSE